MSKYKQMLANPNWIIKLRYLEYVYYPYIMPLNILQENSETDWLSAVRNKLLSYLYFKIKYQN